MSEREIRHIVDVAEEEEVIEEQEREMIHSIFELGDTLVREVMTPRPDMVVIEANYTLQAAAELAVKHGFSRIPVYENEPDNIIGVLYTKDLFRPLRGQDDRRAHAEGPRAAGVLRPGDDEGRPTCCARCRSATCTWRSSWTSTATSPDSSRSRTSSRRSSARSPTSTTSRSRSVQPVGADGWRVQAKTPIWEFNEQVEATFPEDEAWDTVGGMVASALGEDPRARRRGEPRRLQLPRRAREPAPHRHGVRPQDEPQPEDARNER